MNGRQIAFDETGCVLTLERVEAAFASHVIEIDGHTLTTTEHHEAAHHHHHRHVLQDDDAAAAPPR